MFPSQLQPLSRAHCSTARWPPVAASSQVSSPQLQPFCRAHCRTARWPPLAAHEHVPRSQEQPFRRSHCSNARCPPAAAAAHKLSIYLPMLGSGVAWVKGLSCIIYPRMGMPGVTSLLPGCLQRLQVPCAAALCACREGSCQPPSQALTPCDIGESHLPDISRSLYGCIGNVSCHISPVFEAVRSGRTRSTGPLPDF